MAEAGTLKPWRTGNHYPVHVYQDNIPVATFHDAEDARMAVHYHNSALRKWSGQEVDAACEVMHDALLPPGRAAREHVLWIDSPEAYKEADRAAVRALLAWLTSGG